MLHCNKILRLYFNFIGDIIMQTTQIVSAIDAVQTAQRQFVSTFVTDEKMAESVNKMIDAGNAFAKEMVHAGSDMAKSMQEAVKQ